jgi:NtrC-family two-component system response regulator AlgB
MERKAEALQDAVAGVMPSIDLMDTASAEMREAAELARRAADGSATILIRGESGTGKRTVARAIHGWSPRANRPLAIASCRAPTAAMLETEWFGTARKMPGGHVASQPGRVAWADGGTLVLEDVEQLSLTTQSKLLRLIQNREYERPADFAPLKADVRIVATTTADLVAQVAEGQFSSDLLYALQGVQIELPPLRRRPEDIEPLANRYLAFFARQTGRGSVGFSHAAIDALRGHSWPGNIRELRNLVERAVLVGRGQFVEASDFPPGILNRVNCVAIGDPVPLERVEELHIRGVLQSCPSIEAAADTLGMDSVTLWRRRKKYGI